VHRYNTEAVEILTALKKLGGELSAVRTEFPLGAGRLFCWFFFRGFPSFSLRDLFAARKFCFVCCAAYLNLRAFRTLTLPNGRESILAGPHDFRAGGF
jgi:hypothetical protein